MIVRDSMVLCNTVDEAVVDRKSENVENEDAVGHLGNLKMEGYECDFAGRKLPRGLKYLGDGRWRARVWHPKLKFGFWLGTYNGLEEAVDAINMKKADFREGSGDEFEGVQLPMGVRRRGYRRWQAQMTHPILKFKVSLGCYDSPEEAAMAINIAKAEFVDTEKNKSVNVETGGSNLENDQWDWVQESSNELEDKVQPSSNVVHMSNKGSMVVVHDSVALKDIVTNCEETEAMKGKKSGNRVPFGVRLKESGTWESWATDPLTGVKHWLLSCKTFEEAVNSAMRKRVEFDESCKGNDRIRLDSEAHLKKPDQICGYGCTSSICDPVNSSCVSARGKLNNGVANVRACKRRKAMFPAKTKRAEFGGRSKSKYKARLESETTDAPEKSETDFGYGCPTAVLGSKNCNTCAVDNWCHGRVDVPNKQLSKVVHDSPTSVFYPVNASGLDIRDGSEFTKENAQVTICASNFEEAIGLGFINEYGQLLGEYSMLDEQMAFSLPDENVAVTAD